MQVPAQVTRRLAQLREVVQALHPGADVRPVWAPSSERDVLAEAHLAHGEVKLYAEVVA